MMITRGRKKPAPWREKGQLVYSRLVVQSPLKILHVLEIDIPYIIKSFLMLIADMYVILLLTFATECSTTLYLPTYLLTYLNVFFCFEIESLSCVVVLMLRRIKSLKTYSLLVSAEDIAIIMINIIITVTMTCRRDAVAMVTCNVIFDSNLYTVTFANYINCKKIYYNIISGQSKRLGLFNFSLHSCQIGIRTLRTISKNGATSYQILELKKARKNRLPLGPKYCSPIFSSRI